MTSVNGPHDVGGLLGLGAVPCKEPGPVFREEWEGRVFALSVAGVVSGTFGVDDHKTVCEGLHPVAYMSMSYWEQWLYGAEVCFVGTGAFSQEDVDRRVTELTEAPDTPLPGTTDAELESNIERFIADGLPQATLDRPHRFAVGDRVRVKHLRVEAGVEHTSLPMYVQGQLGTVALAYRPEPLGDAIVAGEGPRLDYVYAVRFEGSELWPDGDPRSIVHVDLFESYLEAADEEGKDR